MSKIIEPGNTIYECKTCGCKFTIESKDINYEMATNFIMPNGYYYARCPQCRSKVKINNYNANDDY